MRKKQPATGLIKLLEAAAMLSVCRTTLYTLMDSGELAWVKIGRTRRIRLQDVEELVERNTRRGGEQA